jgi:hypothetical protein
MGSQLTENGEKGFKGYHPYDTLGYSRWKLTWKPLSIDTHPTLGHYTLHKIISPLFLLREPMTL